MRRIAIVMICLGLAACGGRESETTAPQGLEEGIGGVGTGPGAVEPAEPEGMAREPDPDSKKCLDLVQAGQLGEAVPVCLRAARANPDDQQIQQALAKAQAAAEVPGSAGEAMEGMMKDPGSEMP